MTVVFDLVQGCDSTRSVDYFFHQKFNILVMQLELANLLIRDTLPEPTVLLDQSLHLRP